MKQKLKIKLLTDIEVHYEKLNIIYYTTFLF